MTRLYQYIITKRKPRFLSEQEFIDICINKLKYTESESLNLYKFMQIYKTQRANRKMSIFTQV